MSNLSLCIISALVVLLNTSLIMATPQENSSMDKIDNTTLNNTLLNSTTPGNISLNASGMNDIGQSKEAYFTISSNATGNRSTYNLDVPTAPAKNASNLWYIIQAKPHGYV